MVLPGVTEDNLISRAIRTALDPRKLRGETHPRWMAVAWVFVLDRGFARRLCHTYGFDPDEAVSR